MTEAEASGERTPKPEVDSAGEADAAVEPQIADVLGKFAQRTGIATAGDEDATVQAAVWQTIGGWRGLIESIAPSLVFVLVYAIMRDVVWAVGISVAIAGVAVLVRVLQRSPIAPALGGLLAAAASAALAVWTGRGEDNFLFGLITNVVYGVVILIATLARWSPIGLAVGFMHGDVTGWRNDKRLRTAFFWLGLLWAGLFFARLAVQLPLYLAGNVGGLGLAKLLMGIPLFAPVVAVTWLVTRGLYAQGGPAKGAQ